MSMLMEEMEEVDFDDLLNKDTSCLFDTPAPLSCAVPAPVMSATTPQQLMVAFQMQYNVGGCDNFNFDLALDSTDMKTFRLTKGFFTRSFHQGHPCSRLKKGDHLRIKHLVGEMENDVESIDVDRGSITFQKPMMVPVIMLDHFAGMLEPNKVYENLKSLNAAWEKDEPLVVEVLTKREMLPKDLEETDKIGYVHGKVGSGKTYKLVSDYIAQKKEGQLLIAVAPTNSSLESISRETQKQGHVAVQFTKKDVPFSFSNYFSDVSSYKTWDAWRKRRNLDESERERKREAMIVFRSELSGYLVLVTPSKLIDLRRSFDLGAFESCFYLDEVGLTPFLSLASVLTCKVQKLRLYGDHLQLKPWDKSEISVAPQEQVNLPEIVQMSKMLVQSVAQWFYEMNVPYSYLSENRRNPKMDVQLIDKVFYGEPNTSNLRKWGSERTLPVLFMNKKTSFVPPSLLQYPYMSNEMKEKESCRMSAFLTSMQKSLVAKIVPTKEARKQLVILSPYNWVLEALAEVIDKYYPLLLNQFKFKFVTTRKAQGDTFQSVYLYLPSNPGLFVTDSHMLVAFSRHTEAIRIMPYKLTNLVPASIVVALHNFGIVEAIVTTHGSKNPLKNILRAGDVVVGIRVKDRSAFNRFFLTATFQKYRQLLMFNSFSIEQKNNFRVHSGIGDEVINSFLSFPAKIMWWLADGDYRHALMVVEDQRWQVPCRHKGDCELRVDGRTYPRSKRTYVLPFTAGQRRKLPDRLKEETPKKGAK